MPKSRASLVVVAAMLLTMVGGGVSLHGALDMFLDLGPGIPGESTDKAHKDQVEVLAWSWGMSNPGGTAAGVGKASFQDLSLIKYVDKASPPLRQLCAGGTQMAKATLIVRKTGVSRIEYIKIELADVLVSSVSTGGSSGESRLTENVSLNFAKVQVDYLASKPDGSPDASLFFRWDISGNSGTLLRQVTGLTARLLYTNQAPVARLTWVSTAGASYQVWAASDLNAAFQRYGGPTASAGAGTTSVTVPADAIRKLFRIESLPVP